MDHSTIAYLERFLVDNGAADFFYLFLERYYSEIENGEIVVILAPVDGALKRLEDVSNRSLEEIVNSEEGVDILNNHISSQELNIGDWIDNLEELDPVASTMINDLLVIVIDKIIYFESQLERLKFGIEYEEEYGYIDGKKQKATTRLFNKQTGKGKITKREHISLNELWESWCNSTNPKHADSLFCAAGWGNPLALFVLRLRFTLPPDPNMHVLNNLKAAVKGVPVAETLVNKFLAKIDKGEVFKWSDFSALIQLVKKLPVLKNKLYSYVSNKYGISVKGEGTAEDASKHRINAEKAIPNAQFPRNAQTGFDLDSLYDQKCIGGPNNWKDSLFCEIGMNDVGANYIGRMGFTLPQDPNNHIIKVLLDSIKESLKGTATVPQTLKDKAVLKGLDRQLGDVINKIDSKQLLSWDDLRNVFVVSAGFGLGFGNLLSFDIQSLIISRVNDAIKKLGLQFAQ